jgi:lipopolysaccharide/colanic/teichoic acid biosynthesis glycosyltransferase
MPSQNLAGPFDSNLLGPSDGANLALMSTPAWSGTELALSRGFDVVLAVGMTIVALPLILLISLLVKVTSRGPVLFKHQRVGVGGVSFQMQKFRTMRVGTDLEIQADPEQWEAFMAGGFKLAADDPRITRVGRWLRRSSLDELPQLFDVLGGSMGLVGIRPIEPAQLATRPADYRTLYCLRRPGITGLWQVSGRSSVDDDDRLRFDREYIANWSAWKDMWLLVRTPLAVLRLGRAH